MVKLAKGISVREAIQFAFKGKDIINAMFKHLPPLNIEFEKVFSPYLLLKKKRYAGWKTLLDSMSKVRMQLEDGGKVFEVGITETMHLSGVEAVRRDNAPIAASTVGKVLELLLKDRDPKGADAYCKNVVRSLHTQQVKVEDLTITKGLTKMHYANAQPHVKLNERKMDREGPEAGYRVGDRIPYVVCCLNRSGRVYDNAEEPSYVTEHKIPIDVPFYIRHISRPLRKIMDKVFQKGHTASEILAGPHTLVRVQAPCSNRIGTVGAHFAVVGRTDVRRNGAPEPPVQPTRLLRSSTIGAYFAVIGKQK
jgi:DNA polymerase delta subunit 1